MTGTELIEHLQKVQSKNATVMVASGTLAVDAEFVSEILPENIIIIF